MNTTSKKMLYIRFAIFIFLAAVFTAIFKMTFPIKKVLNELQISEISNESAIVSFAYVMVWMSLLLLARTITTYLTSPRKDVSEQVANKNFKPIFKDWVIIFSILVFTSLSGIFFIFSDAALSLKKIYFIFFLVVMLAIPIALKAYAIKREIK